MPKIAVFSFDAGGSELIASLERAKSERYRFYNFSEPNAPFASLLQNENIMIISSASKMTAQLKKIRPDLIITGTSWQSEMHEVFLRYAKEHAIPSLSFVDHWTPYKTRFKEHLPDYLATFDDRSTQLAKAEGFKEVVQIRNYHLQELQDEFKKIRSQEKKRVLFLSEPTAAVAKKRFGDRNYWGFDEIDIFKEVRSFASKNNFELVVRLHPSDTKERYEAIDPDVHFSDTSLLEDIATSKIIVGIDTIALYYAYRFGKKTLALMPTNKRSVVVPLPKSNIVDTLQKVDPKQIETATTQANTDNGIDFDTFVKKVLS